MDDTFSVIGTDHIDSFLQHLNSIESCIQFTMERVQWSARCDDTKKGCGSISTSVYRKMMHTDLDQYLNFVLHHPAQGSSGQNTVYKGD